MPDPRTIIEDFFSAISLPRYRKYINSCLRAANSRHYWKKEDPGSLLYFQQKMEDLMDAAKLLSDDKSGSGPKTALVREALEEEMIDPVLYMDKYQGHTQWETFPRYLSKKEFLNPYLVFRRFFRYKSRKGWHNDFREIIFYALSPHSCSDDLIDLDLLKISRHLLKLAEAAHLVLLRDFGTDQNDVGR